MWLYAKINTHKNHAGSDIVTSHKQRHIVVWINHGFFDIVAEEAGLVLGGLFAGLRSVAV